MYNPMNQNRMIDGTKAFEMGIADRLFDSVEFFDESLAFLEDLIEGKEKVERKPPDTSKLKNLTEAARIFLNMKGAWRSAPPYRAIELIQGACDPDKSVDECFADEDKALGDLIKSRQCKAGVYSFDLIQTSGKKARGSAGDVNLGLSRNRHHRRGFDGFQLALLFLRRYGVPVLVMKDIKQEFLDKGLGYVKGELASLVAKERGCRKPRLTTCSTSL